MRPIEYEEQRSQQAIGNFRINRNPGIRKKLPGRAPPDSA
jgi:hypothetical protein